MTSGKGRVRVVGLGDNVVVRSVLGVAFALLALYYLRALARCRETVDRLGQAARILMCLAMLPMLGHWPPDVPTQLGVPVFLAAALWFGYLALFPPARGADGHRHPWFDAAKMLAMVWMYVAMSPTATRPAPTVPGMSAAMPDMPGMGSGSAGTLPTPTWSVCGSVAVAALLLVGALWLLRGPIARRRAPGADDWTAAAMAAAMAVAVLLLL